LKYFKISFKFEKIKFNSRFQNAKCLWDLTCNFLDLKGNVSSTIRWNDEIIVGTLNSLANYICNKSVFRKWRIPEEA